METLEIVITFLFNFVWDILQIPVPGFDFNFADVWVGFGVIYISIFIFHRFFLKND